MKSTMAQLLERGMEKGKAEGIAEGMEKGIAKVAKVMLMEGDPISKIAKVTSLSRSGDY